MSGPLPSRQRLERPAAVGTITRAIILALIERQNDLAERRAWIEIARDTGQLSAGDAERQIARIARAA